MYTGTVLELIVEVNSEVLDKGKIVTWEGEYVLIELGFVGAANGMELLDPEVLISKVDPGSPLGNVPEFEDTAIGDRVKE